MRTGIVALAFVFVATGCAHGSSSKRRVVDGGSTVVVEGTSTGRDFTCVVPGTRLEVHADGLDATPELEQILSAVKGMTLDVPAEQLDCENGTDTRFALTGIQKRDQKAMRFALTRYEMGPAAGTTVPMRLVGEMTFAGRTKPVTVEAEATTGDDGRVRIQGLFPLKMTDWGAESARLRLGKLNVSDDLVLRFDLALKSE